MKHIKKFQKFIVNESEKTNIDSKMAKIPEEVIKKMYDAIVIKNPGTAPKILSSIKRTSPVLYDRIKNVSPENKSSVDISSDLGDLGF